MLSEDKRIGGQGDREERVKKVVCGKREALKIFREVRVSLLV